MSWRTLKPDTVTLTDRRGLVVSALEWGLEGRKFKFRPSRVGTFRFRGGGVTGGVTEGVIGVILAQGEGWHHTVKLHPLYRCVFEGVVLFTSPVLQMSQFPGLVKTGIIRTEDVVCGLVE